MPESARRQAAFNIALGAMLAVSIVIVAVAARYILVT